MVVKNPILSESKLRISLGDTIIKDIPFQYCYFKCTYNTLRKFVWEVKFLYFLYVNDGYHIILVLSMDM